MNSLCTIQEEDDFYKTTYGGFNDEGDDGDFNYNSPQEDDDVVDSDFSIDENDEVKSDPEDDESSRKKAKRGDGVQTKAYKVDNINLLNLSAFDGVIGASQKESGRRGENKSGQAKTKTSSTPSNTRLWKVEYSISKFNMSKT